VTHHCKVLILNKYFFLHLAVGEILSSVTGFYVLQLRCMFGLVGALPMLEKLKKYFYEM
jgi:hypothetical protein